ncbi:hypothetical protein Glove_123g58 [Diversispora epigaea]|uniref:Uncharacterized protein n=1 Tax=Diversispora epigaea TaxID=1348612 RepID=A0A397IYW5_9GLOM|nr:hypothetical protein Glove_123g58 [Diversispora epigaea]
MDADVQILSRLMSGQVYDLLRRTRGRPDLQSERKGTKVGELVLLLLSIIAVKIEDSSGTNRCRHSFSEISNISNIVANIYLSCTEFGIIWMTRKKTLKSNINYKKKK